MCALRYSRKAFTLIELLVVIAIISLLLSILMPSLGKAKQLARRATCAMQLSSIGKGCVLYSTDWEEYFPYRGTFYPPENKFYSATYSPATLVTSGSFPNGQKVFDMRPLCDAYFGSRDTLYCTGAIRDQDPQYVPYGTATLMGYSYYNMPDTTVRWLWFKKPGDQTGAPFTLSKVTKAPLGCGLWGCRTYHNGLNAEGHEGVYPFPMCPGLNMLYVDGSVGWIDPTANALPVDTAGNDNNAIQMFWGSNASGSDAYFWGKPKPDVWGMLK